MLKNSEIRKQVTEWIKPKRLIVFGYAFLFSLITGIIGFVVSVIVNMAVGILSIPIQIISKVAAGGAGLVGNLCYFIMTVVSAEIIIVLLYIFRVGYLRQMLLLREKEPTVTPIDFFKLGFKDYKRTLKVALRLWLKYLPANILCILAFVVLFIGANYVSDNVTALITLLSFILLLLICVVWSLVIALLYQTTLYELAYDENTTNAKEILAKARETIRGYLWKWTRMNIFYSVTFGLALIAVIVVLVLLFVFGISIVENAGNGAAVVVSICMILGVFIFVMAIMACSFLMHYFKAKNIYNLDKLYNEIKKEKENQSMVK